MSRPRIETFLWRGTSCALVPVVPPSAPEHVLGYELTCPLCQQKSFLNTGMGRKPEYALTHDENGRITIHPVLTCPFPACRFAVVLRHGVAFADRRGSVPTSE